ncbi:unnamed protein product [Cylindrotheca closterium]|uniref:Cation efflux protein transmembrane domain-containing protein n=1 Tax=Cylindrotheca closterium TaxID=2856 RepID=A0AAD2CAF3_9STRA|nr:unnamed protein product [Cylindrotheca closterium]
MNSYQNTDAVRENAIENDGIMNTNGEGETTNEYVLGVAFWTFVLFMATEAVFAVIAGSQAMLTDALAMSVDALTYLFNLVAERVKHRPISDKEKLLPTNVFEYRRERLRLYLELVPPLVSVVTLIYVTVGATQEASASLMDRSQDNEDVSVGLMFWFSLANLFLDFLNVACFAKAHQAYGMMSTVRKESAAFSSPKANRMTEQQRLLGSKKSDENDNENDFVVNLNMCSAWTHIMADTLRSAAVLIAAAIAVCVKSVTGSIADSVATIVVSVIILISLLPLLRGLVITGKKIIALKAPTPTIDV